ncbi:CHRD domain-containing protein [Novosphingobium sp. JCM 18896]|uniref:CHRD domain-containing protein n=1 Tax=Novosphingobium sp. JCM 18896 TaxID=2989731 RepID=UPI002221DC56|nr:CHRD domain-containing protein [Novosphingobium sp. JCM 18896]MCW1430020.1 CHRD domain-containing protein [Novosphingobium sp. JCM 18896]
MPAPFVPLAAAGVLLAVLASPAIAASDPPVAAPIAARLSGGEEVPPADTDGTGSFAGRFNDTLDQLCYVLTVERLAHPTAAHIHAGAAGENGPPVVTLRAPTAGTTGACATLTAELAIKLSQHPERYYVNVHDTAHPNGAVRGQLGR